MRPSGRMFQPFGESHVASTKPETKPEANPVDPATGIPAAPVVLDHRGRPPRPIGLQKGQRGLIRDDGMPFPYVPLLATNPRFREYRGDPTKFPLTKEQGMAYLFGVGAPTPNTGSDGELVISTATKEELLDFALTEYGVSMNPEMPVDLIRQKIAKMANLT